MNFPGPLTQLGRYQLTSVLGRGAMGLVYEATDPRLGRKVAIKTILKSHLLDDAMARDYSARFVREAQAAARLNHPNIVTVFDFGEEDEVAYIVMEFIEGRELAQHFEDNHFFDRPNAVRIMCELLDALSYAHDRGIVHRDIKPANVMIDRHGRVKLTDFGVARLADSNADRTLPGTMVGTPSYMSPEQIQGQAVGSRADLFAAGVILYQFLTHQKPFTGAGQWTIQRKIVSEDPVPPSFANHDVPPVFDAIVQRALAKQPDQRYQTAAAFAIDLRRALGEMSTSVDDPDATVVASRPMPSRFGLEPSTPPAASPAASSVAATASAALAASGLRTATAPPFTPQASQPPAVSPPAASSRTGLIAAAGGAAALAVALGWWFTRDRLPQPPEPMSPAASAPLNASGASSSGRGLARTDSPPAAAPAPPAAAASVTTPTSLPVESAQASASAPPARTLPTGPRPDGALRPAPAGPAHAARPTGAGSTVGSRDGAPATQPPRANAARCADLLQRLQLGEDLSPENLNVFQKECKR